MKVLFLIKKLMLVGIMGTVIIAGIYFVFIRPWIFRMGCTKEEVKISMPGDELVKEANYGYTQAVTVDTPREFVWKYLIQVGYKRGGWYNLDFVNRAADKDYFYENNKSAERIIPELQNLKEGDKIYFVPAMPPFEVIDLKKNDYMLMAASDDKGGRVTWVYQLKDIGNNKTRLYVRWISREDNTFSAKMLNLLIVEPGGAGIQQSLNLKGIKKRAEKEYFSSSQNNFETN
jgi:hypothetical protein